MRWAWISVGAFIIVIGSLMFFASFLRFGLFSRYGYGMPMMGGGGLLFGVLGFMFLCLLIFMAVRVLAWGSYGHSLRYHRGGDDAEEILRQRYARGEITKEQFDQMLSTLRAPKN
jgi:putative membrane protein